MWLQFQYFSLLFPDYPIPSKLIRTGFLSLLTLESASGRTSGRCTKPDWLQDQWLLRSSHTIETPDMAESVLAYDIEAA